MKLSFSHIGWQVGLPLLLMVADIISGYYNAWKKNEIKSTKMRDGIGKKIAEVMYILIGFAFDFAFGVHYISTFVAIYITYMELTSLIENMEKIGVPFPATLKNKLNGNSQKNDENSENQDK